MTSWKVVSRRDVSIFGTPTELCLWRDGGGDRVSMNKRDLQRHAYIFVLLNISKSFYGFLGYSGHTGEQVVGTRARDVDGGRRTEFEQKLQAFHYVMKEGRATRALR